MPRQYRRQYAPKPVQVPRLKKEGWTDIDDKTGFPNPYHELSDASKGKWTEAMRRYRASSVTTDKKRKDIYERLVMGDDRARELMSQAAGGKQGSILSRDQFFDYLDDLTFDITKDFEKLGTNTWQTPEEYQQTIESVLKNPGYSDFDKHLITNTLNHPELVQSWVQDRREGGFTVKQMFDELPRDLQTKYENRKNQYIKWRSNYLKDELDNDTTLPPETDPEYFFGRKMWPGLNGEVVTYDKYLDLLAEGKVKPEVHTQKGDPFWARERAKRDAMRKAIAPPPKPKSGVFDMDFKADPAVSNAPPTPPSYSRFGEPEVAPNISFIKLNDQGVPVVRNDKVVAADPTEVDAGLKSFNDAVVKKIMSDPLLSDEEKLTVISKYGFSATNSGLLGFFKNMFGDGSSIWMGEKPQGFTPWDPERYTPYKRLAEQAGETLSRLTEYEEIYASLPVEADGSRLIDYKDPINEGDVGGSIAAGLIESTLGVIDKDLGRSATRTFNEQITALDKLIGNETPTSDDKRQLAELYRMSVPANVQEWLESEGNQPMPEGIALDWAFNIGYAGGMLLGSKFAGLGTRGITSVVGRAINSPRVMKIVAPLSERLGLTPEATVGMLVNTQSMATQIELTQALYQPNNVFDKEAIATSLVGGLVGGAINANFGRLFKRNKERFDAAISTLKGMELTDPRRAGVLAELTKTSKLEAFINGYTTSVMIDPAMEFTRGLMDPNISAWDYMEDYFDWSNPMGFFRNSLMGTIDAMEARAAATRAMGYAHKDLQGGNYYVTEEAIKARKNAAQEAKERQKRTRPQEESEPVSREEPESQQSQPASEENARNADQFSQDYASYEDAVNNVADKTEAGEAPPQSAPKTYGEFFAGHKLQGDGTIKITDVSEIFPDASPAQVQFMNKFISQDPIYLLLHDYDQPTYDNQTKTVKIPKSFPLEAGVLSHEGIGHQFTVDLIKDHATDPLVQDMLASMNEIMTTKEWLDVMERLTPSQREYVHSSPYETAAFIIENQHEFKQSDFLSRFGLAEKPLERSMDAIRKQRDSKAAQPDAKPEDAQKLSPQELIQKRIDAVEREMRGMEEDDPRLPQLAEELGNLYDLQDQSSSEFGYFDKLPKASNRKETVRTFVEQGALGQTVEPIIELVRAETPNFDELTPLEQNNLIMKRVQGMNAEDINNVLPPRPVRPVPAEHNIHGMMEDILGIPLNPFYGNLDTRHWVEWYAEQIANSDAPKETKEAAQEALFKSDVRSRHREETTIVDLDPKTKQPYTKFTPGIGRYRSEINQYRQIEPAPYLPVDIQSPLIDKMRDLGRQDSRRPNFKKKKSGEVTDPGGFEQQFQKLVSEVGFKEAAKKYIPYGYFIISPMGHLFVLNPNEVAPNRAKAIQFIYESYRPLIVDHLTNPASYTEGVPGFAETFSRAVDWSQIPLDGPVTTEHLETATKGLPIQDNKVIRELLQDEKYARQVPVIVNAYRNMFRTPDGTLYHPPYVDLQLQDLSWSDKYKAAGTEDDKAKVQADWGRERDQKIWEASVDILNRLSGNNMPNGKKHNVKYTPAIFSPKVPFDPEVIQDAPAHFGMPKFRNEDGSIHDYYITAGFNQDGTINVMTLPTKGFNEMVGLPEPDNYVESFNDATTYLNPNMGHAMETAFGVKPTGAAIKLGGQYDFGTHKTLPAPSRMLANMPEGLPPVGMVIAGTALKNPRMVVKESIKKPGTRYMMKGGDVVAELTENGYKSVSEEDAIKIVQDEPQLLITRVSPKHMNIGAAHKPDAIGWTDQSLAVGTSLNHDASRPELNKLMTHVGNKQAEQLTQDTIAVHAFANVLAGKPLNEVENKNLAKFLTKTAERIERMAGEERAVEGVTLGEMREIASLLEASAIDDHVNEPLLRSVALTYPKVSEIATTSFYESYDNVYQLRQPGATVSVSDGNLSDITAARENSTVYIERMFPGSPLIGRKYAQHYEALVQEENIFTPEGFLNPDTDMGIIVPEAWLDAVNQRRLRAGERPVLPGSPVMLIRTPVDNMSQVSAAWIVGVSPDQSTAILPKGFQDRSGTDTDGDKISIGFMSNIHNTGTVKPKTPFLAPEGSTYTEVFSPAFYELKNTQNQQQGSEALDLKDMTSPSGKRMPIYNAPIHTNDPRYPDFMYEIGLEDNIGNVVQVFRQVQDHFRAYNIAPNETTTIGNWTLTNNPDSEVIGRAKIEAYDSFSRDAQRVHPDLAFATAFDLKHGDQYISEMKDQKAAIKLVRQFKEELNKDDARVKKSPAMSDIFNMSTFNPANYVPYNPSSLIRRSLNEARQQAPLLQTEMDIEWLKGQTTSMYNQLSTDPAQLPDETLAKINVVESILKKSSIDNPFTDPRNYFINRTGTLTMPEARAMVATVNYSLTTLPITFGEGEYLPLLDGMGMLRVENGVFYWEGPGGEKIPLTKVFQPNGLFHPSFEKYRLQNKYRINDVVPLEFTGKIGMDILTPNLRDFPTSAERIDYLRRERDETGMIRITFSNNPRFGSKDVKGTIAGGEQVVLTVNPFMTEHEFRTALTGVGKQFNQLARPIGSRAWGMIDARSLSLLPQWQADIVRQDAPDLVGFGSVFFNNKGMTDQEASELAGRLAVALADNPREATDIALNLDTERYISPWGVINGARQAGLMPEVEVFGERMPLTKGILAVGEYTLTGKPLTQEFGYFQRLSSFKSLDNQANISSDTMLDHLVSSSVDVINGLDINADSNPAIINDLILEYNFNEGYDNAPEHTKYSGTSYFYDGEDVLAVDVYSKDIYTNDYLALGDKPFKEDFYLEHLPWHHVMRRPYETDPIAVGLKKGIMQINEIVGRHIDAAKKMADEGNPIAYKSVYKNIRDEIEYSLNDNVVAETPSGALTVFQLMTKQSSTPEFVADEVWKELNKLSYHGNSPYMTQQELLESGGVLNHILGAYNSSVRNELMNRGELGTFANTLLERYRDGVLPDLASSAFDSAESFGQGMRTQINRGFWNLQGLEGAIKHDPEALALYEKYQNDPRFMDEHVELPYHGKVPLDQVMNDPELTGMWEETGSPVIKSLSFRRLADAIYAETTGIQGVPNYELPHFGWDRPARNVSIISMAPTGEVFTPDNRHYHPGLVYNTDVHSIASQAGLGFRQRQPHDIMQSSMHIQEVGKPLLPDVDNNYSHNESMGPVSPWNMWAVPYATFKEPTTQTMVNTFNRTIDWAAWELPPGPEKDKILRIRKAGPSWEKSMEQYEIKRSTDEEKDQREFGYFRTAGSVVGKVQDAARGIDPKLSAEQRKGMRKAIGDWRKAFRSVQNLTDDQYKKFTEELGNIAREFGMENVDQLDRLFDHIISSDNMKMIVDAANDVYRDDPETAAREIEKIKRSVVLDYLGSIERQLRADRNVDLDEAKMGFGQTLRAQWHTGGVGSLHQDSALGVIDRLATNVVPVAPDDEVAVIAATQNGQPIPGQIMSVKAGSWYHEDTGRPFNGGWMPAFIRDYAFGLKNASTTNEQYQNVANKISRFANQIWMTNDDPRFIDRIKAAIKGKGLDDESIREWKRQLFASPDSMTMARNFLADPASSNIELTYTDEEGASHSVPVTAPEFGNLSVTYDGQGSAPVINFTVTANALTPAIGDQPASAGVKTELFSLQSYEKTDVAKVVESIVNMIIPADAVIVGKTKGGQVMDKSSLRNGLKAAVAYWIGAKVSAEFIANQRAVLEDTMGRALDRTAPIVADEDGALEPGHKIAATMDRTLQELQTTEDELRNASLLDAIDMSSNMHGLDVVGTYDTFVDGLGDETLGPILEEKLTQIADELFADVADPELRKKRVLDYMSMRANQISGRDRNFNNTIKFSEQTVEFDETTNVDIDSDLADLLDVKIMRMLDRSSDSPNGFHKRIVGIQQDTHNKMMNAIRTAYEMEQEHNIQNGIENNRSPMVEREIQSILGNGRVPTINTVPKATIMRAINKHGVATSSDTGIPFGTATTLATVDSDGSVRWMQGQWLGGATKLGPENENLGPVVFLMDAKNNYLYEFPLQNIHSMEIGRRRGITARLADESLSAYYGPFGGEEQMLKELARSPRHKNEQADNFFTRAPSKFSDAPYMFAMNWLSDNINNASTQIRYLYAKEATQALIYTPLGLAAMAMPGMAPIGFTMLMGSANATMRAGVKFFSRWMQNYTTGLATYLNDPYVHMWDLISNVSPNEEGLLDPKAAQAAQRFQGHYGGAISEAAGDTSTYETSRKVKTLRKLAQEFQENEPFEVKLQRVSEGPLKDLANYDLFVANNQAQPMVMDANGNIIGGAKDLLETNVDMFTTLLAMTHAANHGAARFMLPLSYGAQGVNNLRLMAGRKQAETEASSVKSTMQFNELSNRRRLKEQPLAAKSAELFGDDPVRKANALEEYIHTMMGRYTGKTEWNKTPLAYRGNMFSHFSRGRAKHRFIRGLDYIRYAKDLGETYGDILKSHGLQVGANGLINPLSAKNVVGGAAVGATFAAGRMVRRGLATIIAAAVGGVFADDEAKKETMGALRGAQEAFETWQFNDVVIGLADAIVTLLGVAMAYDKSDPTRLMQAVEIVDQGISNSLYNLSGGVGVQDLWSAIYTAGVFDTIHNSPEYGYRKEYTERVDNFVERKAGNLPYVGGVVGPAVRAANAK